jgi:cholera toxin transcriptional activator
MFLTVQVVSQVKLPRSYPSLNRFDRKLPSDTLDIDMADHGTDVRQARRYRFGIFEADAATGELRRQGVRVKLSAQPFQVLVMLLERPGELLTREEISRELWPDGTFVDYEHGVNSAVNRIREALRDTASSPRYVETLARRGYRFVAPVERIAFDELPSPSKPKTTGSVTSAASMDTAEPESKPRGRILASPQDLPKIAYPVVLTLFVLLQLMYLAFYIGALANLAEIEELLSPLPQAALAMNVLIITAATLIPVRAFVLCAVLFHAPGVRSKFLKLWPFLLALDELWALSPFLLLHHINAGLAVACMTLLVYSPFAQRSLVLMGAGEADLQVSATPR